MHKRIGKGLSVLLLLLGISCASAFAGSTVIGSVAGAMNATVSGQPLIPNSVVFSGDNLNVADGATVIALGDGSRLMFGRDTKASFLRDGDQVTVQLEQGSVSVYHTGANSGLRVKVNDVSIEPVAGFTTMGQVAAVNGGIAVSSQQGLLRVQGQNSSVTVAQGKTITIRAKNAAFKYQHYHVNIVDTPGHADFGGEVERIMNMIDGVLLVVDAGDGPQAQTRFVLRKALEAGAKPIVVINKIDRENAAPHKVLDQVFDLFQSLHATDEQLDFPVIYASAKLGYAKVQLEDASDTMGPLFDAIIKQIRRRARGRARNSRCWWRIWTTRITSGESRSARS